MSVSDLAQQPFAPSELACKALTYRRGAQIVLDGVDLSVRSGEVVSLLGVNGAGKSTLLRLLLGLSKPSGGGVLLDGRPLESYRRNDIAKRIAYVPQSHQATFPYTVRQMVSLGRVPHRSIGSMAGLGGALRDADRMAIDAALARLQIGMLAERPYTALSGGERQRVMLARALAQGATILVLDEPMTGLDYGHQARLIRLLASLAREGYAVLNTSHHPDHVLDGATRAVLLQQGRIVADGLPRDVIDATSMAALYGVGLRQVDVDGHRFFRADDG